MLAKQADICKFKEHVKKGPVNAHLQQCVGGITEKNVDILGATSRGEVHVLTLEAL